MSAGAWIRPSREEILDLGEAEPLDVDRVARDEMAQPLDPLGRADQPAGAAAHDLAFLALGGASRIRGQ